MKICYLGNFQPDLPEGVTPWSTESHVAAEMELLGHEVTRLQEGTVRAVDVPRAAAGHDVFWWTQTFGLAETGGTRAERVAMVEALNAEMPTVGFHLDLWFGIGREAQVDEEPYFRLRHLFTADGGHQEAFAARGINHQWSPPGVFSGECYFGEPRPEFRSEVAFVGNWRGGYHPESVHRRNLVRFLQRAYRGKVRFWPRTQAIRGRALNDLYASAKIVVGDSCMVPHLARYCSDRIPETTGRGGFLLHPFVEGVIPDLWKEDEHLGCWPANDWDALKVLIDRYLTNDGAREAVRIAGHEHTRAHHTYGHRVQAILDEVMASEAAA